LSEGDLAEARRGSPEQEIAEAVVPLLEPSPRREGAHLSERISLT